MKFRLPKTFDWLLFIIPIILICVGLVTIYSLTYYNENVRLFYNQITYAMVGLILMIVFTFIDYRHFKGFSPYLYLIGLTSLVLVLILGKTSFGATRWINLGFFDFQPSEVFKLILIIGLASYLAPRINLMKLKDILVSGLLFAVGFVLIVMQPDLGSASILFIISLVLLFFTRLNKIQIFAILLIVFISIPVGWFTLKDYQKERVRTFLEPSRDAFGSGYNVLQSLITVGSGGLTGRGFGYGPQSQLNFLPVAHTDFIFAGVAEATGFIGSSALVLFFMLLILKMINVARSSKDNFGTLLTIGITTMIFSQVFINIGMNLGIMPVTGIPLPFVSYGGSSLIVTMISLGILQSIYLRHKKISFSS